MRAATSSLRRRLVKPHDHVEHVADRGAAQHPGSEDPTADRLLFPNLTTSITASDTIAAWHASIL
jgi:hypothetical protein